MRKFTRRESIGLGVGAMAALSLPRRAARAAVPVADVPMPDFTPESGAELRVLRPAKFVPADETLFNENTQKFVDATGIPVKVDYQAWEDLRPQTAVTANTGAGPDVVLGWTDDPHLYSDKLIEITDIADYLGAKYGGWYPVAERYGKKFGTENWVAIPFGGSGGPALYRKSWINEAGFDEFPGDTDGFLKLCQAMQKINHPAGFALGHAVGDANSFCHWLVWSHGGFMIDEDQKVAINSKETIAALKYGRALYETFIPGTLSWNDVSNNKAMLAGELGVSQNGVSLYNAFRNSEDPNVKAQAEDVYMARMPTGPVGFGTETALVVNAMIFAHTEYPNAAKAYLTFMMEVDQYDPWLTASSGYWAQPLKAYAESEVWSKDPKVTLYRDTMKDSLWLAYKGPISEASAAVVADYVMVDMVSSACSGTVTAEEAAAEAERRALRYYKS